MSSLHFIKLPGCEIFGFLDNEKQLFSAKVTLSGWCSAVDDKIEFQMNKVTGFIILAR